MFERHEIEALAVGARMVEAWAGPPLAASARAAFDLVHTAIGDGRRLTIRYAAPDGSVSTRSIRPLALAFWGKTWTISAYCELRRDFRSFRLDRILAVEAGEPFAADPALSLDAVHGAGAVSERNRSRLNGYGFL